MPDNLTEEEIAEIEAAKKRAHDEAEKADEELDRVDRLGEEQKNETKD